MEHIGQAGGSGQARFHQARTYLAIKLATGEPEEVDALGYAQEHQLDQQTIH